MKTKYIFALFIFGSICGATGGLFKIMHWPGGSDMLVFSTILILLFWLLLLWKTFTHPALRDFMNK
jgi:hypothetical protein